MQWSRASVRNPCFCTVQLLGSRSDSVFPGVRYLCVVPSLLFARPCCRWAFPYLLPLFIFSFLRSLLVIISLSLSRLLFLLFSLGPSSLLSQGFFFFFLNSLVYFALPGEVSIAYRGAIVYCFLRKSLGCLNWLVCMALLGEVSIG